AQCRALIGELGTRRMVSHTFPLDHMQEAYEIFGNAAETGALKIVLGVPQHEVVPVPPAV
ncbi:alcohol dehydrogenase, partial [Streptomyces fungicidicus]